MLLLLALAACPTPPPPIAPTSAPAPATPDAPPEPAAPTVVRPPTTIPEVTSEPTPTPPREPIPGLQRPLGEHLSSLPPLPGPDPRACTTDADCEVSCTPMGSCCGSPCGCQSAYSHDGAARVEAHAKELCPSVDDQCPAVDCRRDDARVAVCQEGLCVARTDLAVSRPPACPTKAASSLPGVSISLGGPCDVTLADALAGIDLPYTLVIDRSVSVIAATPDGGGCVSDGPGHLPLGAEVAGDGHVYDPTSDTGLCAPRNTGPRKLAAGRYEGTLHFEARDWTGPSDTMNQPGAAFPAGTYTFRVWASGTVDGAAFRVEASRPITLR